MPPFLTLCNVPRDKRLRTAPLLYPACRWHLVRHAAMRREATYREISGFAPPRCYAQYVGGISRHAAPSVVVLQVLR